MLLSSEFLVRAFEMAGAEPHSPAVTETPELPIDKPWPRPDLPATVRDRWGSWWLRASLAGAPHFPMMAIIPHSLVCGGTPDLCYACPRAAGRTWFSDSHMAVSWFNLVKLKGRFFSLQKDKKAQEVMRRKCVGLVDTTPPRILSLSGSHLFAVTQIKVSHSAIKHENQNTQRRIILHNW